MWLGNVSDPAVYILQCPTVERSMDLTAEYDLISLDG